MYSFNLSLHTFSLFPSSHIHVLIWFPPKYLTLAGVHLMMGIQTLLPKPGEDQLSNYDLPRPKENPTNI